MGRISSRYRELDISMTNTIHALIIDDNAMSTEVLAQLLALEGATSTVVRDPGQLPDAISDLPHLDVVFLDLEMPSADGYTVLEYLKDSLRTQAPIVACTAHANEVNTARQHGFHSFLGKPLDADAFPGYLRRILNDERVWVSKSR